MGGSDRTDGEFRGGDRQRAPPYGYQEHAIGGHVVDDQKAVQQLVELWELLRNQALNADESLDWLSELSGKKRE